MSVPLSEERQRVSVDRTDVARTANATWSAFAATLEPKRPHTVASAGRLCMFDRDELSGKLKLREHDQDTLRDVLDLYIEFGSYKKPSDWDNDMPLGDDDTPRGPWRPGRDEDWVAGQVPREVVVALLKRPLFVLDRIATVPRVDRVVDVPVFAPDKSLATEIGHHPDARVFYEPRNDAIVPPPTWADAYDRDVSVRDAQHLILDDLLGDFPFADNASRAHALALVIEPFVRGMVQGPAPMYVVIATEQGTGKSLFAQACLSPGCGDVAPQPPPDTDESSFQKRLLSILIGGPQAVLFDNVVRPLASSTLSVMLTSGQYEDRVLGKSQMLSFPVRHTTVATMNNPLIDADLRRRVVPIYLDAGVERPWERTGPPGATGWSHPDLLGWARAHRPELAGAALTLTRHWVEGRLDVDHAGEEYIRRPLPSRMMGSFEEWSTVIGGIVTAAGVPGFGDNLSTLYDEQAEDDSEEARFLAEWPEDTRLTADQIRRWVTVGLSDDHTILPAITPPPVLQESRTGQVTQTSVGNGLRAMKGRVRSGRRLLNDRRVRPTEWYVEIT